VTSTPETRRAYVKLRLVPVSLTEARRYITEVHRHNDAPVGHKASVGLQDEDGNLRGVGVLGRSLARKSDDGRTLEIYRVATDGVANGCSMLYGALVRVAWNLGYDRVLTYTLEDEPGTSLKAAGWTDDGKAGGGDWARATQPNRLDASEKPTLFFEPKMPMGRKVRWVIDRKKAVT
jgi:hypothetical protein